MLAADAELADRDPAVPGLLTLLDDGALTGWLAGQGLGPARRRYLRYKPGTGCVLGLDLDSGAGWRPAVLTAASADGADKLAKTRRRAPGGAVLAVDESAHLLLTTMTADRDLPAVRALGAADGTRAVLGRLLPHLDLSAAVVSTLRHKPARRWVGLLEVPGAEPLVLRAFPPAVAAAVAGALEALGRPRVRTPQLHGADLELGLLVLDHLPGESMDRAAGGGSPAQLQATGTALARLHQHAAPLLRRRPATAAADAVQSGAASLARLLPASAARCQELADRVTAQLQPGTGLRVCHGDFSADQVVLGPDGVSFADLDEVSRDEPVVDLGSIGAASWSAAAHTGATVDLGPLLAGYGVVRPLPPEAQLRAHTAAALLRRAAEPFRTGAPQWDAAAVRTLDAAEAALG